MKLSPSKPFLAAGLATGAAIVLLAVQLLAQPAYPPKPAAPPEVVKRGDELYHLECAFCHGEDARGGDMASNLLRSGVVLNDQNGELLGELLAEGIPSEQMPSFKFSNQQVQDLAAYLHSFRVNGYDVSRMRPMSIVTGDPAAGKTYFDKTCAGCHADRNAIGAFVRTNSDPQTMQQRWLMPGGRGRGGRGAADGPEPTPVTVTVTLPSGQQVNGELERIDDFLVSLTDANGEHRSFRIQDGTPKVEIHDPRAPHKALLPQYRDEDIRNVTAYLITLQ